MCCATAACVRACWQSHVRACLDATRNADELLREALGAKKLKELRRQRHTAAEHGAVHFEVARRPAEVATAIETFLALEASGWKARRGTALGQHDGDAAFVRRATAALAETGQCESCPCAPARRRSPPRSCCGTRIARSISSSASTSVCKIFAGRGN